MEHVCRIRQGGTITHYPLRSSQHFPGIFSYVDVEHVYWLRVAEPAPYVYIFFVLKHVKKCTNSTWKSIQSVYVTLMWDP
jgi:hypothetical protein